ncbi:NAD(P)-binding protein [Xylariaceae sp. FL0594]|nr:NAD(P)-binding protein [Xylariaceae sp. FL0594]
MAVKIDMTPEKEASFSQFLYRQLFVHPREITKRDVNLSGKVAVITGASGGIGLECARQLLDLGASKLILAVRNESKAAELVSVLSRGREHQPTIERARQLQQLDIVILNAGIYRTSVHLVPSTGHEENIQVNYLSNILLLTLLLPVLKEKAAGPGPGRLTMEKDEDPFLPSFDKPQSNFNPHARYSNSNSDLTRDARGSPLGLFVGIARRLLGNTPSVGARNIVDAVVNHGAEAHGQYYEVQRLTPMSPFVYSEDAKKLVPRLWKETMNELAFAGVEDIIKGLSSP